MGAIKLVVIYIIKINFNIILSPNPRGDIKNKIFIRNDGLLSERIIATILFFSSSPVGLKRWNVVVVVGLVVSGGKKYKVGCHPRCSR